MAQPAERGPGFAGSVVMFFVLVFAVTWAFWLAAWAAGGASAGHLRPGLPTLLFYSGVFAPAFVAVWLIWRREGGAAVRVLLGRLFQWRAGARWYLFALTYMAGIKLAAAVIHRLATGVWPRFGAEPWYLMLAAIIGSTILLGQAGEEIGWRGYALPRLAARMGLARASILIGVIWAAWHLPVFFLPGTETTGQSFPLYLIQVTALSVAIAWLYAHTNGSLLLTMLMHSAINNTKDIVPAVPQTATNPFSLSPSLLGWLGAGLLWLTAAFFLARMPKAEGALLLAAPAGQ